MELKEQIRKLVSNQKWPEIKTWFTYWESDEEMAEKCLLWGRLFLREYFREKSPPFHLELLQGLLSNRDYYIAAPRGHSKTTLIQLVMMFSIVNSLDKFIVLIEKTHTEAGEVLFAIRDEFETNSLIKSLYGNLISKDSEGRQHDKAKDTQADLFINGVRLRGKGFNSPIRGLKSKEYRPTTIFIDDVESDIHITSAEQRLKYRDNFVQGVVPAIDVTGSIKMMGTILHQDSLLKGLIEKHNGKIYKAFDRDNPEGTLIWPERWSYKRLMKYKDRMKLSTSKFYQEFLNEPIDDESRRFKWEWLQKKWQKLPEDYTTYICVDVADSVTDSSDYTGVVVASFDDSHRWYLRFVKRYKVTIKELVDLIFELWQEYKPEKIGVERKSFEFQIEPLLQDRTEQTGIYPSVIELKHSGRKKEERIVGALEGRFEMGRILFKEDSNDDQELLRGELYDFPMGKHDDLIDAAAYLSQFSVKPYTKKKKKQVDPAIVDTSFEKSLKGIHANSWLDY